MHDNHHRIVGFCAFCFVLVLPRSPAMKKCVFFCLAISCRRTREIPAAMPRGRGLPQNRQKEKATHLRGFCCLSVTKKIPGFEGEKLTTVEKIQLFSFTVGHCSIHSRYFALVIFLAFNFFFCLHHSFKKSPTSSKSSKSKTISIGTHPLQPCSQSYQIIKRIMSSGVSALDFVRIRSILCFLQS